VAAADAVQIDVAAIIELDTVGGVREISRILADRHAEGALAATSFSAVRALDAAYGYGRTAKFGQCTIMLVMTS